jgi:hypothetical protein
LKLIPERGRWHRSEDNTSLHPTLFIDADQIDCWMGGGYQL